MLRKPFSGVTVWRFALVALMVGCSSPTEPRVVQRHASQTMAPLEEGEPRRTRKHAYPVECESHDIWVEIVVDGVRYWEILTVLVCP
jgi:hypothetical protein